MFQVFFCRCCVQICVAGSGIERVSEESLGRDSMLVLISWHGLTIQASRGFSCFFLVIEM